MDRLKALIKQAAAYIPSGASLTGDLSARAKKIMEGGIVVIQPGDYVRIGTKDDAGISLAAPIGYDVWYLYATETILPFETAEDEERTNEILERLDPFLSKLQDIKPLKTLRSKDDLSHKGYSNPDWDYWENSAPFMIKMMRYETILEGRGFKYYSSGMPSGSIGYLAFPVGQLGVMEIVSLIGESVTEKESFTISGEEAVILLAGIGMAKTNMMPPVHNNRDHCVGTHLIERGYLAQDNVELMSEDFTGQGSVEPHKWLRYWLRPEDTFPVPGEFVALLAKSELYHVWWFQESYPFLYSGNWWETEYYTSGIVKEVIEPDDDSEEETNIYKIWIRGFEMYLRPSDFAEYLVDERVAVVKALGLSDNMDWTLLSDKDNDSSSEDNPDEDWRVVPISFYE